MPNQKLSKNLRFEKMSGSSIDHDVANKPYRTIHIYIYGNIIKSCRLNFKLKELKPAPVLK